MSAIQWRLRTGPRQDAWYRVHLWRTANQKKCWWDEELDAISKKLGALPDRPTVEQVDEILGHDCKYVGYYCSCCRTRRAEVMHISDERVGGDGFTICRDCHTKMGNDFTPLQGA